MTKTDLENIIEFLKKELGEDFWFSEIVPIETILKANQFFYWYKTLQTDNTDYLSYLLTKSSDKGHFVAQYLLAMKLSYTNKQKANLSIHESSRQGYHKALYELSRAYLSFPELFNLDNININLSKQLCIKAKEKGNQEAIHRLMIAPLFGTFGERINVNEREKLEIIFNEIKKLANEGNIYSLEFMRSIGENMEDLIEFLENMNN